MPRSYLAVLNGTRAAHCAERQCYYWPFGLRFDLAARKGQGQLTVLKASVTSCYLCRNLI